METQKEPRTKKKISSLSAKKITSNISERKWVGAHVSGSNGLQNAVHNCLAINGKAFALFVRSQRKWSSPPLKDDIIQAFKSACTENHYSSERILPHGSYLINLGNPNKEKRDKSYEAFLDELTRCEKLGLKLYNFHPGSTVGECSVEDSIQYIAECINKAHQNTSFITIVLENMAGQGNVIGSKFEELADIIKLVKNKERVGICIDTCHAFSAGYDLRTKKSFSEVMKKFEDVVGIKYLKGVHLNDSIEDLGSCKDRHDNIGKGKIGLECFRFIMNDDRFNEIPLILETPAYNGESVFDEEIKLLYSLVDKKETMTNFDLVSTVESEKVLIKKLTKNRKKTDFLKELNKSND